MSLRFFELLIAYVANSEPRDNARPAPDPTVADPRTNRRDREMFDWVKREMETRRYSVARGRTFLDHLRGTLRRSGPIAGEPPSTPADDGDGGRGDAAG